MASRRVICISERVREHVLEGVGRNCRTSVVYNGVDPEVFAPAAQPSPDRSLILSVGNLIPIKGHEVLIRSVASLALEFPSLSLEIIGNGAALGTWQNKWDARSVCISRDASRVPRLPLLCKGVRCLHFLAVTRG